MTTSYCLFPIDTSDAEVITSSIDVPAMQNDPLFRTMFPTYSNMSPTAREVMTQWYIDGLEEALKDQSNHMFLKVCQCTKDGDDGSKIQPVGFCGCEIVVRAYSHDATKHREQPAQKKTYNNTITTNKKQRQRELPETLGVDGWLALSEKLGSERRRVLKGLDNICRLTFMAVHPEVQRQGIGSMMLKRICDETDRCRGRCAYVLAAPEGVSLYSKFGFEVVGQVETPHGNIMSMFRPARQ